MNMRRILKQPTLRMNTGGDVPGEGTGDKIPALYAPGEFVVSNAMMDAAPGLRGQLRDLRGNVLAAQGKTVAQADAKALGYDAGPQGGEHGQARDGKTSSDKLESLGVQGRGDLRSDLQRGKVDGPHRVSLRALDGFEVNERPWTSADSRTFAKQPGPGNPNVGPTGSAEAAAFRAPPVAPPASGVSLEPTTSGLLRDKVFGSSADWAKTADTLTKERSFPGSGVLGKVASKLAAPLAVGSGGYSAYQGASEGDVGKTALGVGDAVAGAALMTPAAPAAAGYLAARGAYEAPQMLRDAIGPRGLETIGGTINQIGRKTGLWGTDDSAYLSSKGAMPTPTAAPTAQTPVVTQPNGAGTNQAAYDKANADVTASLQKPGLRTANVSATKQANGNTLFSGTDVSGPVTYDGNAAKSLRNPGGNLSVVPGMSQAQIDQTLTRPGGGRWTPQDEATARANLRDGVDVNRGIVADKQPEFINAFKARTERRGQDLTTETQRRGQDITSADSRYGHELTSEVSRNRLRYDMNKDQRDYQTGRADKGFEQQQSADKAWTEHTATTFRTKDDKGNDVPDTQKAAAYTTAIDSTIGQLIPQFAKSPDPKMRAYAEDLTKRGRAALDKEDLANLQVMFERQQLHARTAGGLNPLKSSGPVSQNLLDYKITGKDNSWFQNRSKTAGGQTIPDVNLRYGADANYVMPNFGAGSTYLTPNKLRGE